MKLIKVEDLKERMAQKTVIVIDVREPAEYRTEHIPGAHSIPLGDVAPSKLPSTDLPVVLHCRTGRRCVEAYGKLIQQHPSLELYTLEGGIVAWNAAGYPVERHGRAMLPIDQQAQLAAGIMALGGVALGTFVHPGFYALCAMVGAGLTFAGLTGWCGMAKVLAKMPWNR